MNWIELPFKRTQLQEEQATSKATFGKNRTIQTVCYKVKEKHLSDTYVYEMF